MSVLSSTYNSYAAKYSSTMVATSNTTGAGAVSESAKANKKGSIADELQLSPQTALKGVIAEFKQSKASSLNISLTVKSNKAFSSSETQQKITDAADKLLRMVSRNEDEYKQLKSSFTDMFGEASKQFSDTPTEEEVANMNLNGSASVSIQQSSKEMKVTKGALAGVTVKYSSYKITMSFNNEENAEASDSKSIANSFTDALASFFGYKSESTKKSSSKKEASNKPYTPTNKSEAEALRKAQLVDAFSSNSVSVTASATRLRATVKNAAANQNSSASASIKSSSTSVNASSTSVRASASTTSSAVNKASSSYQRLQELKLQGCDPIVLDLSGEGINLTEAGKGANFDINADGMMDSTAWVAGDTAMLVYDKNGNNRIDDGSELFGDQNGAKDGFAELAKYDSNNDGKIDSKDSIYKNLKLYRDLNGDGKMSENEFSTLGDMGIKALNLNATEVDENINGNSIVLSGSFEREDGSTGEMADAIFGYSEL